MKTPFSILATMALLAMVALSTSGVHAEQTAIAQVIDHSNSIQSAHDVKSHRSLRSMDTPKQIQPSDGKPKHHHHHHHNATKDGKQAHRALGQTPVTPAPTTTTSSTATSKPKVVHAATKSKTTHAATTKTGKSSDATQQKPRNLGESKAKQQQPLNSQKQGAELKPKNGHKHH